MTWLQQTKAVDSHGLDFVLLPLTEISKCTKSITDLSFCHSVILKIPLIVYILIQKGLSAAKCMEEKF